MFLTTLCYIEKDDAYLMLHRTKKEKDINKDKWIGIGGKFLPGETPEECLIREALEETGVKLTNYSFRGIVTFLSLDAEGDEEAMQYMHLFTADAFEGTLDVPFYYPEGATTQTEEGARCGEASTEAEANSETAVGEGARCDEASAEAKVNADAAAGEGARCGEASTEAQANSDAEGGEESAGKAALEVCDEGDLYWVRKTDIPKLNLWEGDHLFLELLATDTPFFSMKLTYRDDRLIEQDVKIY